MNESTYLDSYIHEQMKNNERWRGVGNRGKLEALSTASLEQLLDDVMTDRTFLYRVSVLQKLGNVLERIKTTMKHNSNAQFIHPEEARKIIGDMIGGEWSPQSAVPPPAGRRRSASRQDRPALKATSPRKIAHPSTNWPRQGYSSKTKVKSNQSRFLGSGAFDYPSVGLVPATGAKGMNILNECNRALDELLTRQSSSLRVAIPRRLPFWWKSKQLLNAPIFPPVAYRDNRSFRLRSEYLGRQILKSSSCSVAQSELFLSPASGTLQATSRAEINYFQNLEESDGNSSVKAKVNKSQDTATDTQSTTDFEAEKTTLEVATASTENNNSKILEERISVSKPPSLRRLKKSKGRLRAVKKIQTLGDLAEEQLPLTGTISNDLFQTESVGTTCGGSGTDTETCIEDKDTLSKVTSTQMDKDSLIRAPPSNELGGNVDNNNNINEAIPITKEEQLRQKAEKYLSAYSSESNDIHQLVAEIMKFKLHALVQEQTKDTGEGSQSGSSVLCGKECSTSVESIKYSEQSYFLDSDNLPKEKDPGVTGVISLEPPACKISSRYTKGSVITVKYSEQSYLKSDSASLPKEETDTGMTSFGPTAYTSSGRYTKAKGNLPSGKYSEHSYLKSYSDSLPEEKDPVVNPLEPTICKSRSRYTNGSLTIPCDGGGNGNGQGVGIGFQEIIHRKLLLACAGLSPSHSMPMQDGPYSTSDTDTSSSYASLGNQRYSQQYYSANEFPDSGNTSGTSRSEFMDAADDTSSCSADDDLPQECNRLPPMELPPPPPPNDQSPAVPVSPSRGHNCSSSSSQDCCKNVSQTSIGKETGDTLVSSVKGTLHMAADKLVDDIMTTLVSEFTGLLVPGGR